MAGELDTEGRQEPGKHDRSLSIKEAAQLLRCSERTLRRRIKDGSVQAYERPIPRGFEWRILPENLPAEVDTEARQAAGKLDTTDRQEVAKLPNHVSQPPSKLDIPRREVLGKVDTENEPISQPLGEQTLLKALEMIQTLQQETTHLQEENKQLYGQVAFYQARLQAAEERILMLEARSVEEEQKVGLEPVPQAEPEKPKASWWRRFLKLDQGNL